MSWIPLLLSPGMGGSAWTPAQLSTPPVVWLESDRNVTDAGGGVCSAWNSIAPATINATASGSARPAIQASTIGGLQALKFDGVDDLMTTSSFLGAGYNTAFTIVGVKRRSQSANLKLWLNTAGATNFDFRYSTVENTNTGALSDTLLSLPTSSEAVVRPLTDPEIIAMRYNGVTRDVWKDGVKYSEAATGNMGISGALHIGGIAGFYHDGWVGAVLVINGAPSDADMVKIHRYFATKYSARATRVIVDGNSISVYGDSETAGPTAWPNQLATANPTWQVLNNAVPGQTTAQMLSDFQQSYGLAAAYRNKCVIVFWEDTNSLYTGQTGAQVNTTNHSVGAAAIAAGAYVITLTCINRDSGGGAPVGFQTERAIVNADKNNPANVGVYWHKCIDLTGDSRFEDPNDTTYFINKVHLTGTACTIIKDYVQAAINAAPVSAGY